MNDLAKTEQTTPAVPAKHVDAMTLVSQAVQNGASMEGVQQLIELVKFNDQREAERLFNQAFTAAQREFPAILKSKKGHNSNYAPYSAIVAAIRPVLDNHGLSFRHETETGEKIKVACILAHEAGHSERSSMIADADTSGSKNSIQSIGSSITYLKRYTLEAVTGVVTIDDDTDGNGHSDPVITDDQALQIECLISENDLDKDKWLNWIENNTGEASFSSIPAKSFKKVLSKINQAAKAQNENS